MSVHVRTLVAYTAACHSGSNGASRRRRRRVCVNGVKASGSAPDRTQITTVVSSSQWSVVSRCWPLDRESTTRTDHLSAPPPCHPRLRPFNYRGLIPASVPGWPRPYPTGAACLARCNKSLTALCVSVRVHLLPAKYCQNIIWILNTDVGFTQCNFCEPAEPLWRFSAIITHDVITYLLTYLLIYLRQQWFLFLTIVKTHARNEVSRLS